MIRMVIYPHPLHPSIGYPLPTSTPMIWPSNIDYPILISKSSSLSARWVASPNVNRSIRKYAF